MKLVLLLMVSTFVKVVLLIGMLVASIFFLPIWLMSIADNAKVCSSRVSGRADCGMYTTVMDRRRQIVCVWPGFVSRMKLRKAVKLEIPPEPKWKSFAIKIMAYAGVYVFY